MLLERKKLSIESKKKDLPKEFIKQNLGSLLIDVNDVYERVRNGLKVISLLDSFEDLYKEDGNGVVALDISNMEYDATLDNIAYAKRINDNLCVVVEDILLDEYQMYLYNMHNIDGVIFDIGNVDKDDLKNIVFLSQVMGIELIASIHSIQDLEKTIEYPETFRVFMVTDDKLTDKLPKGAYVIKDESSPYDENNSYIVIKRKRYE